MVDEARCGRPDFTRPLRNGIGATASSLKRKRIYGEDYRELTHFDVTPKFKMLKLDRQQCELLEPKSTSDGSGGATDVANEEAAERGEEAGKRSTVSKRYADPTPTERHASRFVLDWSRITTVCPGCVSTVCLCDGRRV